MAITMSVEAELDREIERLIAMVVRGTASASDLQKYRDLTTRRTLLMQRRPPRFPTRPSKGPNLKYG
jgi:hypothetical protein